MDGRESSVSDWLSIQNFNMDIYNKQVFSSASSAHVPQFVLEHLFIDSYKKERIKQKIKNIKDKYLVPIKITIKFNSGDIVTTKPEGSYDTITYYRYIQKNRDIIWSADNYVEGYTKTGNTKVQ